MSRHALVWPSQPAVRLEGWLVGSVDLACELNGLVHAATGLDAIELGLQARDLGLSAMVLSAADYCTASVTSYLLDTDFEGASFRLLGSVALNNSVGGLNVHAVEHNLMLSGRLVSMPTVSAQHFLRSRRWPSNHHASGPALTILTSQSEVRPKLGELLDVVAGRSGVLAGGYLHASEVIALFTLAVARGVTRLLVVDPMGLSAARKDDVDAMLALGAHVMISPSSSAADQALALRLAASHPERLILGLHLDDVAADLRSTYVAGVQNWIDLGLSEAVIRRGIAETPARLLDLTPWKGPMA